MLTYEELLKRLKEDKYILTSDVYAIELEQAFQRAAEELKVNK